MVTNENRFTISAGLELGSKNRYTNIWPFDGNRKRAASDYVNASYISYFDGPLYIATQGPLPDTVNDFWKMVWEHHSRVIVMLTKEFEGNRAKCHHYWPKTVGETVTYDDIMVTWEAEAEHPDDSSVVARRFAVSRPGESSGATVHVTHLQYVGWPDHGVPDNPLGVLRLRQLARRAQAESERQADSAPVVPMIVHCSAGCGRTGAFCVIDTILAMQETDLGPEKIERSACHQSLESWTDEPPSEFRQDLVFMVVMRFRELRVTMVQTNRQFVFCHEAL
ncbi:receptor/non-receptor type protein-tyrosine phosphatase, partial [Linderina pennispora]